MCAMFQDIDMTTRPYFSNDREKNRQLLREAPSGTLIFWDSEIGPKWYRLTDQDFESIGYPGYFAYLVIFGEIAGGLALIAGVWTRIVAVALLPLLIGATLQHAGNGWLFSGPNGGWEFPAFWTVMLIVQALLGDGAFALRPAGTSLTQPRLAG